jgi:hypothetical protein
MKHMNFAKRALACGLAVALVVTGGNIPSVNVSAAKKASKAKLSKSKVSVIAGSTTTLKVKKAKKKVKWSTSNKKIAKVTKTSGKKKDKATILGVKKGKAVITAKVGSKKLKCTVKVTANKIKSVSVDKLDYSALTVKFTKKTSLNAGDVKVAVKEYKSGSYNTSPKVEALSTKDQKTYRLYLTSGVSLNDYVKLTVGKFSKEVQNKQKFQAVDDSITKLLEKDAVVVLDEELDEAFNYAVGEISYTLKKGSKLPKGLSLVGKRHIIKGIPTAAGDTTVTLIAKDEAGRKANLTVTFKVYDEVTIAARDNLDNEIKLDDYMVDLNASKLATAVPSTQSPDTSSVDSSNSTASDNVASVVTTTTTPVPVVTADPETVYTTYTVTPKGGSGSYKYDLVQTGTDAVKLSTDVTDANNQVTKSAAASTQVIIPYGLAAGLHTYTINITDAADATRTTTATVEVEVVENFNISGTVTDSMGSALSGNEKLYFYPADASNSSDYVYGRTYLKYQEKTVTYGSGDFTSSHTTTQLVGGNYHSDYYSDEYDYDYGYDYYNECRNGDSYKVYTQSETTKVGPLPRATILAAAPTATPEAAAQAEATVAPAVDPAASPAATPYVVPDVSAGNYVAEVPAGTYTVKVQGHNGVKYQLNDTVTISADSLGTANLTMPVRFANATATAKFANDKAVANDWIYFETDNKQYEGWQFAAKTNYLGSFSVSIPTGTYKMYWYDEDGQRQYFGNSITISDDTNVELGDQKLSVSRYEVSGTFKIKTLVGTQEVDELAPNKTLYFYDAKGNVKTVYTEYDDPVKDDKGNVQTEADGQIKYGANQGAFDGLLLDNGTYTVRYRGDRGLSTIGTLVINGADATGQSFVYNSLTAGFTSEFAGAAALTLGQESVLSSTGNNDVLAKIVIPADEATSGAAVSYDFSASLNTDQTLPEGSVTLYTESGETVTTFTSEKTQTLTAGTYYLRLTPIKISYSWYNSYKNSYEYYYDKTSKQTIGNVNVKVVRHQQGYEKSSTALTLNTPTNVVCAKNVTDDDLKYTAYVKLSVEAGKTYNVSYASKTIGADDISVSVVSGSTSYAFTSNTSSLGAGAGNYTFKALTSGDVYLELQTDDTIYTTIEVTATEVVNQ